jgi:Ca-activated chloride channel family protein
MKGNRLHWILSLEIRKGIEIRRADRVKGSPTFKEAMTVEFLNEKAFWAMCALPLLLGIFVWSLYRKEKILKEFGSLDLLSQFSRIRLNKKIPFQALPLLLSFALLIAITARPLLYLNSKTLKEGSLDVVAVMDLSKSMLAEDCGPNISRIEMAKETLMNLMPELAGNRMGIVTFAGQSFPQAELTDDFQALKYVLKNWVTPDLAPSDGSNIGNALSEAVELFEGDERKKIILLYSDGGNNKQDNIKKPLTDMSTRGISVFSVGLGSPEGSRIPVYENDKFKAWYKIKDTEVITRLNEEILKNISHTTEGRYFRITSGGNIQGPFCRRRKSPIG